MTEAVVALGANLGDPLETLRRAIDDLGRLGDVVAVSPAYESAPIGGPEQERFINAVAIVDTAVEAESFLAALHELEAEHGRTREVRWGPRTLDLDLVAHGSRTSTEDELLLPHPRAGERAFVLRPLVDIRPGFTFPDGTRAEDLLADVADQDLTVSAGTGWHVGARSESLRIVIAGPGGAGAALGLAAQRAGHTVAGILTRSGGDGGLGAPTLGWSDPIPEVELVLLTVPDRALLAVATTLNTRLPAGALVAHCSGITPLSVLQPIADAGHPIGGIHPLAALPDGPRGADALRGAGMAIGGSDDAVVQRLSSFAHSLGGLPFTLADEARPGYHAAASMAANHLTALLGAVEEVATAHGVPFDAYRALVEGAVAMTFETSPGEALTGPVARGDEGTVRLQRLAVEESAPELLPLLDALNDATRRLATRD